jgi:hypothetical protein
MITGTVAAMLAHIIKPISLSSGRMIEPPPFGHP